MLPDDLSISDESPEAGGPENDQKGLKDGHLLDRETVSFKHEISCLRFLVQILEAVLCLL